MVTLFPSQVTSLLFFSIMQDYFETIEEKDQICTRKTETLNSNATHSKGIQQCYSFKRHSAMLLIQKAFSNATHSKASSDGSLLNTLKLNLTSRRFDCDNFKKLEQLHKKTLPK